MVLSFYKRVASNVGIRHRFPIQWFFAVSLMALVLSPCMASANIIRVPTLVLLPDGTYRETTIQEGINAAGIGDTVLVANGTYVLGEDLDFNGKAITVQSENGADNCIIDGNNFYFVRFGNSEDHSSVFKGFTLINCERSQNLYHFGSIEASSSSPTIINCTINGYGIFFTDSSPPCDHRLYLQQNRQRLCHLHR